MADITQVRLNGQLYSINDATARASIQSQAVQIAAVQSAVNTKQDQITFNENDFEYSAETGALSLSPNAGITVDDQFNELSVNPVQNRIIAAWKETQELVNEAKADEEFKDPYVIDGVTYSTLTELLDAIVADGVVGGSKVAFGTELPSPLDFKEGDLFGLVEEVTDTSGTLPTYNRYLTLYGCHVSPALNVLQWFPGPSKKLQDEHATEITSLAKDHIMFVSEKLWYLEPGSHTSPLPVGSKFMIYDCTLNHVFAPGIVYEVVNSTYSQYTWFVSKNNPTGHLKMYLTDPIIRMKNSESLYSDVMFQILLSIDYFAKQADETFTMVGSFVEQASDGTSYVGFAVCDVGTGVTSLRWATVPTAPVMTVEDIDKLITF